MSNKTSHLTMIQDVVNRMSVNSFLLKGWSVILISSLFALASANAKPIFIYLAYFPAIAFWGLDGYFLRLERLYRALYDRVRRRGDEEVDFAMGTDIVKEDVAPWLRVSLSRTLLIFHGSILGTIVVVMIIVIKSA